MVLLAKELWHVHMDVQESCWRTVRVRSVTSAYIYNASDVGSSSTEMDLCGFCHMCHVASFVHHT